MKIFSGSSNKPLSEKIAKHLGLKLSTIELHVFPDGERRIKLNDTVVDENTVVIQPTATPVDQNYIELFFIIDALRRSGARSVCVVVPYLGYQRQDHIFRDGESVSLQVMIKLLESMHIDKIIAVDLHSIKIPEFFHIPLVHLSALSIFSDTIKSLFSGFVNDSVLVSPDMGGLRRISEASELLSGLPWISTVKDRDLDTGKIVINKIEGDPSKIKKRAFIIDDMISSGGTTIQSAELLRRNGVEEIYVFVTHAIFSEDAPAQLQKSIINKVFVTDSVFIPKEKHFEKLEILSIAQMVSEKL